MADDDVVEESDPDQLGTLGKASGELHVLVARSGITDWVIVDQNPSTPRSR